MHLNLFDSDCDYYSYFKIKKKILFFFLILLDLQQNQKRPIRILYKNEPPTPYFFFPRDMTPLSSPLPPRASEEIVDEYDVTRCPRSALVPLWATLLRVLP